MKRARGISKLQRIRKSSKRSTKQTKRSCGSKKYKKEISRSTDPDSSNSRRNRNMSRSRGYYGNRNPKLPRKNWSTRRKKAIYPSQIIVEKKKLTKKRKSTPLSNKAVPNDNSSEFPSKTELNLAPEEKTENETEDVKNNIEKVEIPKILQNILYFFLSMDDLPDEILFIIVLFLDHRTLPNFMSSCRRFYTLCQQESFFRVMCFRRIRRKRNQKLALITARKQCDSWKLKFYEMVYNPMKIFLYYEEWWGKPRDNCRSIWIHDKLFSEILRIMIYNTGRFSILSDCRRNIYGHLSEEDMNILKRTVGKKYFSLETMKRFYVCGEEDRKPVSDNVWLRNILRDLRPAPCRLNGMQYQLGQFQVCVNLKRQMNIFLRRLKKKTISEENPEYFY